MGLGTLWILPKESKPSCEERRAGQDQQEKRLQAFYATHQGLGWRGAAKSGVQETFPQPPKERVCACKTLEQEQAQSRRGDSAVTFWCTRILLQEPRGKLSQGTRTQGGQPVVELVASVMEQQRMRVTSQ